MKLNHDEFVALLAKALGSDKNEASRALESWVDAVLLETEKSGSTSVTGLGTFRKTEDGSMILEPDQSLAMEVNHKYAGMSPIEISPPSSVPPEPQEVSEDKLHEAVSEETRDDTDQETESESESEKEKEKKTETDTAPGFAAKAYPYREPFARRVYEADDSDDEDTSAGPFGFSRQSIKKLFRYDNWDNSEKMIWLIPIAAMLIIALLLFFHFDGQRLSRTHLGDQPVVQNEIPVPIPEEDEGDRVIQEFVPSPEPVDEVAPPPDLDVTPEPVEDAATEPADEVIRDFALPYGLKGPEDEVQIGAYTIVVHSLRNERKSEIEKERLENQGYKATRWSAELPSGITTYRVGIGQFQSVSDAERAVEELPEPFRSNNFIIRIR